MQNKIQPVISFAQVMAQLEAEEHFGRRPMIYYSTVSLWWTHSVDDLQRVPCPPTPKGHPEYKKLEALREIANRGTHPTDPSGAPLMQTEHWRNWMDVAKEKPRHFGTFQLVTFMAAHHRNHELYRPNGERFSPADWKEWNRLIADLADAQTLSKFV